MSLRICGWRGDGFAEAGAVVLRDKVAEEDEEEEE